MQLVLLIRLALTMQLREEAALMGSVRELHWVVGIPD